MNRTAKLKFVFVNILLIFPIFKSFCQNRTVEGVLASADTINKIENKIDFITTKAYNFIQEDLNIAQELILIAERKASILQNDTILAYVYNTKGIIAQNKGEFNVALKNYYLAYDKYDHLNITEGKSIVENNLGIVNYYLGNYDVALKHYLNAIKIDKEDTSYSGSGSSVYNNIGMILDERKNYKEALKYYKKSLKIALKDDHKSGISTAYNNIAEIFNHSAIYDSAKVYYGKSLRISEKTNDQSGIALVYLNFGDLALKGKKFELAHKNLNKAEKIYNKIGDKVSITYLLEIRAKVYFEQGYLKKALPFALNGYNNSVELKISDQKKSLAELIGTIYEKQKNYKKALSYYKKFKMHSDSIQQKSVDDQLTNYEAKVKFEAQKRKIELRNSKERAQQELRLKQERNRRNYILIVLLFLILISILAIRGNRAQKKFNRELLEKNQRINEHSEELIQTLQQLGYREQQLTELNSTKDRLFSIIGHDLRGPVGSMQNLMELLTQQYDQFGTEEIKSMLLTAKESSAQTFSLLENLLMWAKTQKNEVVYKPQLQKIKPIIENNIKLLTGTAEIKSIHLKQDIKDSLAFFDSNTVSTIIRNLISNALKFTPEGETITVACSETQNNIEVSVIDTGIGMAQETIDKLLNPNEVFSTFGTNNEKGSGLGIKLCMDLVAQNKGEFSISSELNKGSVFKFTLPKTEIDE